MTRFLLDTGSAGDYISRRRGVYARAREGWPRVVAYPGLPRIRTCPIKAYGSSGQRFAAPRYTEWTTHGGGNGYFRHSFRKLAQENQPAHERRDSHFRHRHTTA